jgi:hypothetical protein
MEVGAARTWTHPWVRPWVRTASATRVGPATIGARAAARRSAEPGGRITDDDPLTTLLGRASADDRAATEALVALVSEELHGLAGRFLRREAAGHTLQPTALVHEAWLRLFGQHNAWEGRQHFLALAATFMRRVLADHARRRAGAPRTSAAASGSASRSPGRS